MTEDLTHVPLVVGNADREGRVERPVELRSLAPTIADLAGASHSFEADSLLEDDAKRPWVASKVFAENQRRTAIRTRDAKFVAEPGRRELFDLATDPDEQEDLTEERPDAAEAFDQAVAHHVASEQEKRAIRDVADDLAAGGEL